MRKIAFLPIDNRPVCYDLPIQIANLDKSNSIVIPDIDLLGDLTKSANIEKLFGWFDSLNDIEIAVLSLDTIAYGGLIPSRRSNDSFVQVKARIDKLVDVIKSKNIKVYAFSSIMRISNNNINEEEKEYWSRFGKQIFNYSYSNHKLEKTNDGSNLLACNCSATRIPQDILDDYLATRERNFKLNKYYIELYKQGVFDTLVFSKDDCAKYGFNVKEAEELEKLSEGFENIFIKTGADEIPLTLLSRALNKQKCIKVCPIYTNKNAIDKISKYEDISVEKSVNSQIELAGARVVEYNDCDLVLLVNNFENEQGELVMDVNVPLFSGELEFPNKPYFIADIVNANGSDNNFIKALFEHDNFNEFYGYAAWNTTGNTLGSAISTALTYFGAKIPDKNVFTLIQLTRLLDDWAYQANVRSILKNNQQNYSEKLLKDAISPFEKAIFDKFGIKKIIAEYSFPWKRFFEIKITLKNVYTNVPFVDILFYE